MQSTNGVLPGTVLVDGFVAATWTVERTRDATWLLIRCLDVPRSAHDEIREEGVGLLRLLAPFVTRTTVATH